MTSKEMRRRIDEKRKMIELLDGDIRTLEDAIFVQISREEKEAQHGRTN